jgi:hypothetical protein
MSDPRSTYGEPVEEPTPDDDVVARAHDSLAHAEAAQRDADATTESADPVVARPVAPQTGADAGTDAASPDPSWYDRPTDTAAAAEPSGESASAATPYDDTSGAETVAPDADRAAADRFDTYRGSADVDAPQTDAERAEAERYESYRYDADSYDTTTATTPAVVPPVAAPTETARAQPIFVQAPEAPRLRGNRGAAGAIGLLAAVAFAVLYLGVRLALGLIDGSVTGDNVGSTVLAALSSAAFWVPVVVFFIAFWLLGAVINRGRWGAWVVFGLLVGLASWFGHILGQLFQAPFWLLTASEGARLVEEQLLAPLAIAAFVIGRELTIWFGAWVASRGRRVTELNTEAQREYERTLEAGPQLARV